jgi:hypothetical protein
MQPMMPGRPATGGVSTPFEERQVPRFADTGCHDRQMISDGSISTGRHVAQAKESSDAAINAAV